MHDQAKLQRMGQFHEQTGCHQAQIEPRSALHPVLADAQLQVEEEARGVVSQPPSVSFDLDQVRIRAENMRTRSPLRQVGEEDGRLGVSHLALCAQQFADLYGSQYSGGAAVVALDTSGEALGD